jgi:hypothetical protein
MIYAPTYVSQPSTTVVHYESSSTVDSHESAVTKQTNEVSERVVSKAPLPSTQRSLAACGAFTLPREAIPEFLTDEMMAVAKDSDELDVVLGNHIGKLQTYIDNMHSKVEQAHLRWMESCKQKLLD